MDYVTIWAGYSSSFFPFRHESLAQAIPGTQFHAFFYWMLQIINIQRLAQVVILKIPIAVFIHHDSTFPSGCFRNKNTRPGESSGMVLDKFHIFEGYAGTVRHGHPVACFDSTIGRERKNPAGPASTHYHRPAGNRRHLAGTKFDGSYTLAPAILHQNLCGEPFIVAGNVVVLEGSLKKGVEHVETGFIGSKPCPLNLHPPEGPSRDCSISFPTPRTTPMLHLDQFSGSFVHKKFHGVLITHPVTAGNGIVYMVFQRIIIFDNSSRATLCRHSMAPHGVDLANHRNTQAWVCFSNGNGCSESCAAAAYHDNIVIFNHLISS